MWTRWIKVNSEVFQKFIWFGVPTAHCPLCPGSLESSAKSILRGQRNLWHMLYMESIANMWGRRRICLLWLFHLAQCTNHRYVRNPANKLLLIGWLIRDAIRFKWKTLIIKKDRKELQWIQKRSHWTLFEFQWSQECWSSVKASSSFSRHRL